MPKFRAVDRRQGIVVETWVSARGSASLTVLNPPYPPDIKHHIKVLTNAAYPQNFYVFGRIASGHPTVSYTPGSSIDWKKTLSHVQSQGAEEVHDMTVGPVTPAARILVEKVEFVSVWSQTPISANLTPMHPEIPLDVN